MDPPLWIGHARSLKNGEFFQIGPKGFAQFFLHSVTSAHVKRVSVSHMQDLLWYWCYYQHWSRELVSLKWKIFLFFFFFMHYYLPHVMKRNLSFELQGPAAIWFPLSRAVKRGEGSLFCLPPLQCAVWRMQCAVCIVPYEVCSWHFTMQCALFVQVKAIGEVGHENIIFSR